MKFENCNIQGGNTFNEKSVIGQQTIGGNSNSVVNADKAALLKELEDLRGRVRASEESDARKADADREIGAAIDATEKGEAGSVRKHLAGIGQWFADFCSQVGANVVSEMLRGK